MKVNYSIVPFPESQEYNKVFNTVFKSYEEIFETREEIESKTVERIMNFSKITGDHLSWISMTVKNDKDHDIVNIFLCKDEDVLHNLEETFKID